ncbi:MULTISPECIES: autotransporter domain-containing protein [Achromobacter]|uniref:autotransporter domain-containing protein n=1 Tax=Achromobacter sp. SD115 TaxID=2782011 RepID=UPI001F60A36B|nr:autotransporter domain-containing protein [Achromobacter sp. SD115]
MNHTYRIVFNRSAGLWQVVSEHARGQGKGGRRASRSARRRLPLMAMLLAALGATGQAQAGPMVTLTGDTTFGSYSDLNLTVVGPLHVGISGVGTLTAADGGQVTILPGHTLTLADSASANGTINIGAAPGAAPAGAGFLATSLLQFGAGTGTLNFNTNNFHDFAAALVSRDAGTHQLNHYAGSTRLVGNSSGFVGKTTVTGGNLQILNILGTTEGRIDAGQAPGATARVSVFSPGSTWALTDNLFVGGAGPGELSIFSSGTVSNQFATVDAQQNDAAKVTVSGVGSLWSNRAVLLVGSEGGRGSVSVLAGGYATSVDGVVGRTQNGSGAFLVSGGGSAWTNGGELRVGDVNGQGTLTIESGGFVSNKDSYVGSMGGSGNVVVRGAGSIWDNSGAMTLGFGIGTGAGSLTIAQGGTVSVGVNGGGAISLAQDRFLIFPTTGTINIGAAAGQLAAGAGTLNASAIQFGAGIATVNFNHTEPAYTFSTPLLSTGAGSHSLNQIAGTTLLTGANGSFRGRTTVSGGKLVVLGQLGGSAAVTGGVLQYGNGVTGAANSLSDNLKVSGAGSTLAVQRGASLAVAGDVEMADGTVLDLMAGTGSPLLQANKVTLGDGVVFRLSGLADKNALDTVLIHAPTGGIDGDFSAVSVGGFTGEVDYLTVNTHKSADNTQYLATYGLSWTASNNLAHGTFTLTDASNSFTLGLPLSDQAANVAAGWDGKTLTKAGAGTLVLQGANTYSGGTAILGGTLQVDRDANLGAAAGGLRFGEGTLVTTASFDMARAVTLGQTGRFDVAANTTLGLTGAVSGAGALVKNGAGTMVLSGSNSHGGGTTIASGTLQIDRDANLGAATGGLAFGDGALAATASFDTARTVSLAQSGRFDVAAGATLGLTGTVSGAGALAKSGDGTLVLSGSNSYGGGTLISGGRLQVSSDANLGAASGGLSFDGGTLATMGSFDTARAVELTKVNSFDVAAGTTLGLGGAITGSGDLFLSGAGTLRLDNGANAYGNTWVRAGTLIGHAGSISGNVDINNIGRLLFEQAADARFAGAISGNGALVKNGAGTLSLDGSNSYSGKTTVSGGRLVVQGVLGGSAEVTGGVLQYGDGVAGAANSLTGNLNVGAAGSALSVQGPATLAVAGDVNLADGTLLDIAAGAGGPSLQAGGLTLGAGVAFALSGIGSASQLDKVLISTRDGIRGDFGSVSVGGFNGAVDYLTVNTRKSADGLQYLASYDLSWTANNNLAHGTFTLSDAANRFVVGADLADQAANAATGWNGRSLLKAGAGTLVLSGNNTYSGGTTIAGGTLQVASDANLGAASGGVAFNGGTLAASASFDTARAMTLTQAGRFEVAGGATLGLVGTVLGNADLIKTGAGTLRLDNAGNAYGNTVIQEGTLIGDVGSIRGNVDNNGSLVFEQGANATFGGAISGGGALVKSGAGTLALSGDSSGFTGSTTIQGGRLALNGKLGGALNIGQGGVLGGRGTVGSGAGSVVTVAAGGTLAPGNSIGTLTVDGDLVIESGARYAVETNPQGADADLIHVTGNATINGGSVAHIGIGGDYGLRSVYTILAADGALSGRFDTVTSDYAFLTPKLGYDYGAGRVSLELARNGTAMATAADTRNQRAAAGAIDSIGMAAGNGLYDAIAVLPDDKGLLRSSFDQLSGEIHASAKTVLLEDSRYVRDAANERLRSAAGAVGASAAPVLASAGGGARLAPATATGPASWIQGLGSWRQTDGDGNAAQVKSSTGGFLLGVDAPVSDAWRLGLMAGYTRTDLDVRDRASSGDSDNYHLGAYGGGQWGALGLRGGLAYSWHDIATRRSVSMPGYSDRLKANYDGRTVQAFADLSYRIDTRIAALEPFANLAYVNLKTDGYSESGGAAALRASSQTTETTYTTLGSRVMSSFELGSAQATARGSLGWRYAFGDLKPTATQAFSAGDAFTVVGVPIAKNSAVLEAGLDVQVSRKVSFDLSYQGQLASGAQDHGVRAGVSVRF